jgi:hypothetical protein
VGEDNFERGGLSTFWNLTNGVSVRESSGANSSRHFASIEANGELGASLENGSTNGLANFDIQFDFRARKNSGREFDFQIGTGEVDIDYDDAKGWCAATVSKNKISQSPVSGLGKILPDVWYHFRFVGRNWGQAEAHYELQLSILDGERQFTRATNLALFGLVKLSPATQTAREFLFNAKEIGPGFDVDNVSVESVDAYTGPVVKGVDTQTLFGKVMCGYQGWFGVPGDGSSARGWRHWTKGRGELTDGNAKVDLWPDVSELLPGDRFPTGFQMADGKPAEVFSSYKKTTVVKHFEWMRDYGIDGVFVQRFTVGLRNSPNFKHNNTVLANCREGANANGRAYAVMYDLSGMPAGQMDNVMQDWRALRREMAMTEDPAYLHHHGKPVVAVWGIGFNDQREYTLDECRRLIEFLKNDPEAGGCTVMIGVPARWRTLSGDAVRDPRLLEIAAMADVISPWTVGRYVNPAGAVDYAAKSLKPDQAWCHERGIDYLPVVFPGFSWHNMYGGESGQIPRLSGQFLWTQFCEAKRANTSMVYVAMFDEVDEGTAIFKCVNDVPVGRESKFVTFEGLPSDYYLKLVGAGGKLLRNEIPLADELPVKANAEVSTSSKIN